MAKYCRYCGNPVKEGAKFCKTCGKPLAKSRVQPKATDESVKASARIVPNEVSQHDPAASRTRTVQALSEPSFSAPSGLQASDRMKPSAGKILQKVHLNDISPASAFSAAGEAVLGDFGDLFSQTAAQVSNVLSPAKALLETIKTFLSGSLGMIVKPKILIPSLLMAALWFILSLMKDSGFPVLETLSRITYAEGGFGTNTLSAVGGVFGKGTVAAALASLFTGGVPSAFNGIGSLFRTKGNKRSLLLTLTGLFLGAGFCWFFGGAKFPAAGSAAAGIAGALLTLEMLGNKNSVFYQLVQSFTAKAMNGVRTAMNGRCDSLLSGMVLGFSLGTVLTIIL